MLQRLLDILRHRGNKDRDTLGLVAHSELGESEPVRDPELDLLADELAGLGKMVVPAASRHRTWALVREEVEQQQASGAFLRRSGYRRADTRRFGWRMAGVGFLLAAALVGGILGLRSAGQDEVVIADDTTMSVTTSLFETTPTTEGTTVSNLPAPSSTSTNSAGSTATSASSTVSTGYEGATAPTVKPGSTSTGPKTTTVTTQQPTSTTGRQIVAKEQRESSARSAASFLAQAVVVGDSGAASNVVAGSAQGGLAQMIATLAEPYGYRITSAEAVSDTSVRVVLEMKDRVMGSTGEAKEMAKRYVLKVLTENGSAVVTGIYASGG